MSPATEGFLLTPIEEINRNKEDVIRRSLNGWIGSNNGLKSSQPTYVVRYVRRKHMITWHEKCSSQHDRKERLE